MKWRLWSGTIHFITSCKVPGKKDCDSCLQAEPVALKDRDWVAIKYYIHNRIISMKRKMNRPCQLWLRCNLISVELRKLLTVYCYNQCHLRYPVKMFVMGFVLIFSFSFKDCYWWFLVQACHLVLTEAAMLTCVLEGYWLFVCFFCFLICHSWFRVWLHVCFNVSYFVISACFSSRSCSHWLL